MMEHKYLDRIFVRFSMAYRERFTKYFTDEETKQEWLRELDGVIGDFHPDWIKGGLSEMLIVHPSWPPTFGEFRELCWKFKPRIETHTLFLPPVTEITRERLKTLPDAIKKSSGYDWRGWAKKISQEAKNGDYRCDYGIGLAKKVLGAAYE